MVAQFYTSQDLTSKGDDVPVATVQAPFVEGLVLDAQNPTIEGDIPTVQEQDPTVDGEVSMV